jgi:hypothetical protein
MRERLVKRLSGCESGYLCPASTRPEHRLLRYAALVLNVQSFLD